MDDPFYMCIERNKLTGHLKNNKKKTPDIFANQPVSDFKSVINHRQRQKPRVTSVYVSPCVCLRELAGWSGGGECGGEGGGGDL